MVERPIRLTVAEASALKLAARAGLEEMERQRGNRRRLVLSEGQDEGFPVTTAAIVMLRDQIEEYLSHPRSVIDPGLPRDWTLVGERDGTRVYRMPDGNVALLQRADTVQYEPAPEADRAPDAPPLVRPTYGCLMVPEIAAWLGRALVEATTQQEEVSRG